MTRGPVPTEIRNHLFARFPGLKSTDQPLSSPFSPLLLLRRLFSRGPFILNFLHLPQCTIKTHDSPIDFARWDVIGSMGRRRLGGSRKGGGREKKGGVWHGTEGGRWRSTVEKI